MRPQPQGCAQRRYLARRAPYWGGAVAAAGSAVGDDLVVGAVDDAPEVGDRGEVDRGDGGDDGAVVELAEPVGIPDGFGVAEVAGDAGFVLVLGHVDHDLGRGGHGAAGEGLGALGHHLQGVGGALGGGAGDLGELEGVGVPAQDLAGDGEVVLVFDGDEAVVFGGEDGVGDGVQEALEVAEAVDGGGFGEGAALDLFGEPVIGISGAEVVGEALGLTGDVVEPGDRRVVHQQRVRLGPGLGEAFAVQVGEQLEVIQTDPPVGHRFFEDGLVVQEPGEAGEAQRLALLEVTDVLQVGGDVDVTVDPVLAPGRERPHRHQAGRHRSVLRDRSMASMASPTATAGSSPQATLATIRLACSRSSTSAGTSPPFTGRIRRVEVAVSVGYELMYESIGGFHGVYNQPLVSRLPSPPRGRRRPGRCGDGRPPRRSRPAGRRRPGRSRDRRPDRWVRRGDGCAEPPRRRS